MNLRSSLLIVMTMLISFVCIGQTFLNRDYYNGAPLINKIYIVSIFIEDDDYGWEEDEIEDIYSILLESQEFLVDQALTYNQTLKFDNDKLFSLNKEVVYLEELNHNIEADYLLELILEELDYLDYVDFLEKNDLQYENVKFAVFLKSDRGLSVSCSDRVNNSDHLIKMKCSNTFGNYHSKFAMAHMFLHSCGTWELNSPNTLPRALRERTKELYEHSIMRRFFPGDKEYTVDELTAWRLGWSVYKPSFEEFDPIKNKEESQKEMKQRAHLFFPPKPDKDPGFIIKFPRDKKIKNPYEKKG